MVLSCPTLRWDHCLMGWGGWPLEAQDGFGLMCFMRSHNHAWNRAWGWLAKDSFNSAMFKVEWIMEVPPLVGLFIINMRLFLIISWVLYKFICGLYHFYFIGVYVPIMILMNMYYDSVYVCLSSCFYLWMNDKYIYGLMDETITNVLRNQCFLAIFIWVWNPYTYICCYTCRLHLCDTFVKITVMASCGPLKPLFK